MMPNQTKANVLFRRRRAGHGQAGGAWDADRGGPLTEAGRVGADLRAARQRLGLALPDVAARLRIRESFLEAVEDGRLEALPGPVYAVGFARAYAALLGLDAAAVARRFRPEPDDAAQKAELDFPAPVPDRGVPAGAAVLLGTLLAAAAYAGWYRFSDDPPPPPAVQALPERLAPLASRATPAADPPPSAAVPAELPPALPAAPGPLASLSEPVVPPLAVVPPPPPAAPPGDESRILLRASADAWVQVRERGGHVLLNRVLRGGESWAVPKGPALLLTTGNAGGTELLVDGETAPLLGPPGAVRRDIALEPDGLRAEIAKAASTARPPSQ